KLDLLNPQQHEELETAASANPEVVLISAQTGAGLPNLEGRVAAVLTQSHRRYRLDLPLQDGAGAAWLHQHGEVLDHWIENDRSWYEIKMSPSDFERFQAQREKASPAD